MRKKYLSGSLKSLLTISAILSLSACSSWFAIGETTLSCDAEKGMGCTNIRAAYTATDNYSPEIDAKNHWVNKSKSKSKDSRNKASEYGYTAENNGVADFVPVVPQVISTVAGQGQIVKPMREPEQVMRVWVNAHQDADGNLVYPSHTFTQVKQPQWAVGTPHNTPRTKTILPPQAVVQSNANTAETATQQALGNFDNSPQNNTQSAPLAD